jgi:hypothetical protein
MLRFRVLQVEASYVLDLPDQKAQVFYVLIALTWWFPEHVCKVFGKIPVMT